MSRRKETEEEREERRLYRRIMYQQGWEPDTHEDPIDALGLL